MEARVEYRVRRVTRPLWGIAAGTMTGDSTLFVGVGLGYELPLGRHWTLTPTFAPGYYRKGHGKDLGFPLEFRSQIELGYEFQGGPRIAVAISHLSNARLGSRNPGQESLTLACEIPLARR